MKKSNINREAPPSFLLTSLKLVCKREKKKCVIKREDFSCGFIMFCLSAILRKFCWVFSPQGFPGINICVLLCYFACFSFSDPTIVIWFRI